MIFQGNRDMHFRIRDQGSVESFVQQISSIVEANMPDEHFGAESLARMAGISRSALHRRLMAVSGKSTTSFIRDIRLTKAMEMLLNTDDTASEIAFKTGFGSPAYFHHCFHKRYGCTPGEARKNEESAIFINPAKDTTNGYHASFQAKGRFVFPGLRPDYSSLYRLSLTFMVILLIFLLVYILSFLLW